MEMRPTGDRTNATFVHASSTPCEQGMNYHIFHRTTELKTFISESHFAWRGGPLIDKSALNLSNGFVPRIHVSLHRATLIRESCQLQSERRINRRARLFENEP
jgi:hypothetical protein